MDYTLQATTHIGRSQPWCSIITDIERLPDWNLEIPKVVMAPAVLDVGSEWVVMIHAMKTHWNSRSRVVELDRDSGRIAYRSQSDDGNPSHAEWRWQLDSARSGGGTDVSVEVDVRPRTLLRRWFLSQLRCEERRA